MKHGRPSEMQLDFLEGLDLGGDSMDLSQLWLPHSLSFALIWILPRASLQGFRRMSLFMKQTWLDSAMVFPNKSELKTCLMFFKTVEMTRCRRQTHCLTESVLA
jgi:hypothetical protein